MFAKGFKAALGVLLALFGVFVVLPALIIFIIAVFG